SVFFTSALHSTDIVFPESIHEESEFADWTEWETKTDLSSDNTDQIFQFDWIPSFEKFSQQNSLFVRQSFSSLKELDLKREISKINREHSYISRMITEKQISKTHRRNVRFDEQNSAFYYKQVYCGIIDEISYSRLQFTAFLVDLNSVLSVDTDVVLQLENIPRDARRKYRKCATNKL
ncbi:hypothetical protein V1511DRAFT_446786, partial [Dipodascopsis uninucleata]